MLTCVCLHVCPQVQQRVSGMAAEVEAQEGRSQEMQGRLAAALRQLGSCQEALQRSEQEVGAAVCCQWCDILASTQQVSM